MLSVAMLAYNHGRFIAQAVESALAQQTDFRFEIVIGEDASPDDTREQVEKLQRAHPEVIRLLLHPKNIGMHRNWTAVMAECRAEFIAFLEGDDYWTDSAKLQQQTDLLKARPEVVAVFHRSALVDETGADTGRFFPPGPISELSTADLLRGNSIPTASVVMRRSALATLPPAFSGIKMIDWPTWIFSSLRGNFASVPKTMSAYREHPGGAWNSLDPKTQSVRILDLFKALAALLAGEPGRLAKMNLDVLLLEDSLNDPGQRASGHGRPRFWALVKLFLASPPDFRRRIVSAVRRGFFPRWLQSSRQRTRAHG